MKKLERGCWHTCHMTHKSCDSGQVYIAKTNIVDVYKIGFTTQPIEKRFEQLEREYKLTFTLIKLIDCTCAKNYEKWLHSVLDTYRYDYSSNHRCDELFTLNTEILGAL